MSDNVGIADGLYSDARQGLSTSSASLLSRTLLQTQQNNGSSAWNNTLNSSPLSYLGTYNNQGGYNLGNIYAMFLNRLV